MKNFKVKYWQTNFGFFKIKAEDEKKAREIAEELDDSSDLFESTGTEFGIEDIEEDHPVCEKCGGELKVKLIGDESYDVCVDCNHYNQQ